MKRFLPATIFAFGISFHPITSLADSLVEPGTCELIVASRPTLEEAKQVVYGIADKRFVKIFEAQNGWYAISIGALRPDEKEQIIAQWKASGKIPQDAYCSTGEKYVSAVRWAPSEPTLSENQENSSGGGLAGALVRGMIGVVERAENPPSNNSSDSGGSCKIDWINEDQAFPGNFSGACAGSAFAGSYTEFDTSYTVSGPAGTVFGQDRSDTVLRACGCY